LDFIYTAHGKAANIRQLLQLAALRRGSIADWFAKLLLSVRYVSVSRHHTALTAFSFLAKQIRVVRPKHFAQNRLVDPGQIHLSSSFKKPTSMRLGDFLNGSLTVEEYEKGESKQSSFFASNRIKAQESQKSQTAHRLMRTQYHGCSRT
jgi:hypothetical protein